MGKRPEWEVLGCQAMMKEGGSPIATFRRPEDAELAVACVNACRKVNPSMAPVAFGALEAITFIVDEEIRNPNNKSGAEVLAELYSLLPGMMKELHLAKPEPEKPKVEQPTTRFGSLN